MPPIGAVQNLTMRQLLGVWAAGSLTLGTVALIFVLHRTGDLVLQPVVELGSAAFLVLLLGAVLAVALLALAGSADSALGDHLPGRLVWTIVVLVGGLAGWGYAASVALALQWAPWLLVVLAYAVGGFTFALVAATLSRAARQAGLALGVSLVLLVLGALLVMRPGDGLLTIARLCTDNLALLLASGVARPL